MASKHFVAFFSRLIGIFTLSFLAAGCGGDAGTTSEPATVTQIALTGPETLAAGLSGQMTATAKYSDGTAKDVTSSVTWTSDDAATLTVSDDSQNKGFVKAVVVGTTRVHAALSGQTGEAEITVSAAVLQAIAVTSPSAALARGTTLQLSAVGMYSDGSTQNLTSAVQWAAGDSGVVQVSSALGTAGIVTALAEGATTVSASLANVTASVSLTVTPATLTNLQISAATTAINVGDTVQLSILGLYSDAATADLTDAVIWVSSDPSLLSISNDDGSHGLATASGSGTVTITATMGNLTASFDLTVN
jgi:hypothetical protein